MRLSDLPQLVNKRLNPLRGRLAASLSRLTRHLAKPGQRLTRLRALSEKPLQPREHEQPGRTQSDKRRSSRQRRSRHIPDPRGRRRHQRNQRNKRRPERSHRSGRPQWIRKPPQHLPKDLQKPERETPGRAPPQLAASTNEPPPRIMETTVSVPGEALPKLPTAVRTRT